FIGDVEVERATWPKNSRDLCDHFMWGVKMLEHARQHHCVEGPARETTFEEGLAQDGGLGVTLGVVGKRVGHLDANCLPSVLSRRLEDVAASGPHVEEIARLADDRSGV